MPPKEKKFIILLTVFIAVLSILNVISGKLFELPFFGMTISAGIICYWLSFPITDVVSEVYGRGRAQLLVWMGFWANLIVLLLSYFAVKLPPSDFWGNQEAFATTLGSVWKIVLASLLAYLAAQSHDVWAYHFWKSKTNGKHMWLRNNLSTVSSQLIDSLVFNGIAFYLLGELSTIEFLKGVVGYWLLKVVIAALDTPLVYTLHYWLTGKWSPGVEEHTETVEAQ
ncbi:MAG: queuosine precursor transporter [Verrucomicrobiota bacterium]